jgi:hypothetical protein
MTRNFDQFYSKFLSESSRNSWNPERFMRVIPRDLFNEAKILAMVSKFANDVNQGKMPGGFIGKLNKKWTVALSEDGELYISGFDLTYKGQKANLTMNYNAGKSYRFPLQVTVENMDLYSVSIYDENGELDSDMIQFEEAPGPGKIDIPDWSSTIEELKRLGKIGLNNNLNDDLGLIPKDDSRGFADSFSNGKINNIKVNKNIIENFDQFCLRFLSESVNDDEYLRLASDPEKNDEELQRIIINMAKTAGYKTGPVFHVTFKKPNDNPFFSFEVSHDLSKGYWFSTKDITKYIGGNRTLRVFLSGEPKKLKNNNTELNLKKMFRMYPLDIWNDAPSGIWEVQDTEFGGLSYLVKRSNQIKSADPVTYDDNGNIIPLSSRFDSSKDDIRY